MNASTPLLLLGVLLLSGPARAGSPVRSGGNLGLGLGGGYWLNGISAKYFLSDGVAVQGVLGGYGLGHDGYGGLGLTGDYLWEMPALTANEVFELGWSAGLGPMVGLGDEWLALGAHGTLGLEFNFEPAPIDLVLEYKPGLVVLPDAGLDLWNFAGHLRIYPF